MKQSAIRERLRRALSKLLPDYDFTLYPIEILRPWQREGDRPAWSIGVRPKEGGNLVSVYSQDNYERRAPVWAFRRNTNC